MNDVPKFPDNPDHPNGTCEACGQPCQVFGCRWCPDCYDEASATLRDQWRALRSPGPRTAAEWSAAGLTLRAQALPIEAPAPWQCAALEALNGRAADEPATLAGLPVTVDRGVPPSTIFMLASRLGRTSALFHALRLELGDGQDDRG